MSDVTALQTESPMDMAGNGQQDKLPDLSSLTLSDSPDIISRELPSDDATSQTEDCIDRIVKDENDIRWELYEYSVSSPCVNIQYYRTMDMILLLGW